MLQPDLTSPMPSISQTEKIQKRLLAWFKKNGRDLPWRKTRDPYAIWISEIMLQQTQVPTVIPYYQKFLKTFPTVRRLAKADLSKVLSIWEGLGYYSRARNLHKASRVILDRFNGKIPDTLDDLLGLPGIGRYTAGAILSIAYNREAAILDGNVKRVLSRLFAVSGNPADSKTEKLLWQISESLVPQGHASSFNQALMDLGAMVCTPKDPQCNRLSPLPICARPRPREILKDTRPGRLKRRSPISMPRQPSSRRTERSSSSKDRRRAFLGGYGSSQTGKSMARKTRGNNWRSGLQARWV